MKSLSEKMRMLYRKSIDKVSDLYFNTLFRFPPKSWGLVDWIRIVFWVYPKYVFFPWLKNFSKKAAKYRANGKVYISYLPPTEGIGGQLCRYATARILADYFKLEYVHHAFAADFHRPTLNWQNFLGFSQEVTQYNTLIASSKNLKVCQLPKFDLRYLKQVQLDLLGQIIKQNTSNQDTLFLVTGYSFFPMNSYYRWPTILQTMRQAYNRVRKNIPVKTFFQKKKITIAVLIRRGEITELYQKKTFQGLCRWVEISWYEKVLKKLMTVCGKNSAIEIFSDAKYVSELAPLKKIDSVRINLFKETETQPFEAFHAMATADIVVCGLSSFPYFAASLSDGIKIVPPTKVRVNYFPEEKTRHWIFPDKNANFKLDEVRAYLATKNT